MNFQSWIVFFSILLEVQGHKVPHLKALRYGRYETRGLSCSSTSSICQDILKTVNSLNKRGFIDSQMKASSFLEFGDGIYNQSTFSFSQNKLPINVSRNFSFCSIGLPFIKKKNQYFQHLLHPSALIRYFILYKIKSNWKFPYKVFYN